MLMKALLAPYQQGAKYPPPASDDAIERLSARIGRSLPESLVDVYKVCDGGPEVPGDPLAANLFYSYRFLAVEDVVAIVDGLDIVRRDPNQDFYPRAIPSQPPGAIKELYVGDGWVPFAHDGAGGHLAIDYDPGPSGTVGQVINFGRDDRVHFQLALDFEAFLERVVRDYRKQKYHHVFGDTMMFVDRLLEEQQLQ